jgi:hypothetical protein
MLQVSASQPSPDANFCPDKQVNMTGTDPDPAVPTVSAIELPTLQRPSHIPQSPSHDPLPPAHHLSPESNKASVRPAFSPLPPISCSESPTASSSAPSRTLQDELTDVKCEVMAHWLHAKQEERRWTDGSSHEGVVLKRRRGEYVCVPNGVSETAFELAIRCMGVRVAMTVNTRVIKILLLRTATTSHVEVQPGLRVQVLGNMEALQRCQKHQFAAFVADPGVLIVWDDRPDQIIARAERLEAAILKTLWEEETTPRTVPSMFEDGEKIKRKEEQSIEKQDGSARDLEGERKDERRVVLMQPLLSAATLALTMISLSAGWRQVAIQTSVDGTYMRFLFVLAFIPQIWLALVSVSILCVVTAY